METVIWWRFIDASNDKVERIDSASNPREAARLVGEYQLAFNSQTVWAGLKRDEPHWTPEQIAEEKRRHTPRG